MKRMRYIMHILCATIVIVVSSCSDNSGNNGDNPVLVKVGKSMLTKADLTKDMPAGLTSADSAEFAKAYIKRWIDNRLISDVASTEIDLTEIDKMVAQYRNRLIEMEYRKRMFETHVDLNIPEDSLRNYYVSHAKDYVLDRPMIQGVYLKVPQDASNLQLIRRLYRSDKQDDIDRLEKEVLTSAIHYDYFRDRWVDWEQIELHIPYDFGDKPEVFLKGKNYFETTAGGFVYLLDIKDVLQPGAYMPYDNAKKLISDRLTARMRHDYDASLISGLYEKSLKDGKIQLFVDLGH